jgi:hypothetical protein
MPETRQASIDLDAHVEAVERILADECKQYEELLAVAQEQGRVMTGSDLEAIAASAQEMAQGLERADLVRREREQLVHAMLQADGHVGKRLSTWLRSQPAARRERLAGPVARVRLSSQRLLQANERNRRLASFCLDLVEEEANVLRDALVQDPAGRYDDGAQPAHAGSGRMVQKQA